MTVGGLSPRVGRGQADSRFPPLSAGGSDLSGHKKGRRKAPLVGGVIRGLVAAAVAAAEAAATFATTEAAGAGTVTAEGRALFARTSDVDLQGATHEVDVFGLSDRILGSLSGCHGHEGEATRTTRELVHHDFHGDHFASLGEVSADVGFGCGPGQIAHEQFVFHIFCFAWFTYAALPVSDLRISICRLNDRQLTGLLRGLSLTLVIFRDKPDRL